MAKKQPDPIVIEPSKQPEAMRNQRWSHQEDSAFLRGLDVYGHVDGEGKREIMSVNFKYFDADDEFKEETMRTKKFWMYRNDAIAFAQAIIQEAMRTAHEDLELEALSRVEGTVN